jgi:hypothetical protein
MRRRLRQSSPRHRVVESFHLWLIDSRYRTFGRRRASPVMSQDHSSPGGSRYHTRGPPPAIRSTGGGASYGFSSALRRGAVSGAPRRPKMPSPGVTLPGPFVTPPSPVLPVAMRWLLTSVENCGVRARCSVRARSRTGRLQHGHPPFIASPFLLEVYLVPSHCGSRTPLG